MMKKLLSLCLLLCLLAPVLPARAMDPGTDPLGWEELSAWAAAYLDRALSSELLNDPHDNQAFTEDGYAYVYDFGTLFMSHPDMDEGCRLMGLVLIEEEEADPRGITTESSVDELLAAYYNENEVLAGSRSTAVLYLADALPALSAWGMVLRDGQRIEAVQYTVHEPIAEDLYTDAGLVYTIQAGGVAAIRAYGLDALMDSDDVAVELRSVESEMTGADYSRVPLDVTGGRPVFGEGDLSFSGLDFLSVTPESAVRLFGTAIEDDWVDNGSAGWLRTMEFGGVELTFRLDADRSRPVLTVLEYTDPEFEGPRAVRIGDSISHVLQRFRFGEGNYDIATGEEQLYSGSSWGQAVYYDDASAELRYGFARAGEEIQLLVRFSQMEVSEVLLSRSAR